MLFTVGVSVAGASTAYDSSYDDTNPEAEEGRFFQSILETVRWLGFEPWKITYSSDNFERLYQLAVELIKRGKGYVCTCDGRSKH